MIDPAAGLAFRFALALLLLTGAMHKLRGADSFRAAISGYAILPPRWEGPFARLIPVAELGLGAALLVPGSAALAALGCALLLSIYAIAIGINLARGRHDIDCGCTGPAGALSLSRGLIVRNIVLIAIAVVATLPMAARSLEWLDGVTVIGCVVVLGLLYAAAETALANRTREAPLRVSLSQAKAPATSRRFQWSTH